MLLKSSWDRYALSRNIEVFSEKNGNKTMKFDFFREYLHRNRLLRVRIMKTMKYKIQSYFYKFFINRRQSHSVQHAVIKHWGSIT